MPFQDEESREILRDMKNRLPDDSDAVEEWYHTYEPDTLHSMNLNDDVSGNDDDDSDSDYDSDGFIDQFEDLYRQEEEEEDDDDMFGFLGDVLEHAEEQWEMPYEIKRNAQQKLQEFKDKKSAGVTGQKSESCKCPGSDQYGCLSRFLDKDRDDQKKY